MSEWIDLPDFPGYSATIDGRVMGPKGRELRSFVNGARGAAVNLYRDGEMRRVGLKRIREMVSRLTA